MPAIGVTTSASGATSADGITYDNTTSGLTAADVQAALDELAASGGGGSSTSGAGSTATQSTAQAIASGTATAVQFDGTDLTDTDGFHDPASNNTRVTVPSGKAGTYLVSGAVRFAHSSGTIIAQIYKNGSTIGFTSATDIDAANESVTYPPVLVDLAEGDYVELYAFQNSGGGQNTTPSGCWLTVVQVAGDGSDTIDGGTFADAGTGTVDGGTL